MSTSDYGFRAGPIGAGKRLHIHRFSRYGLCGRGPVREPHVSIAEAKALSRLCRECERIFERMKAKGKLQCPR